MKLILLIACSFIQLSVFATPDKIESKTWNFQNNPYRIDKNFEAHFNRLPLSGDLNESKLGWPGYHWSLNKAMIANRWQTQKNDNFKYKTFSLMALKQMTKEQINTLSPAEKYDIYMGNFDYPTVRFARGASSRGASEWKGICHGVSPAGLHHSEPKTTTLKSANDLEITFYSSDIKALLAFYYARISDNGITQIGKRCFAGRYNPIKGGACSDVNAGSFHIIMTNRLGLTKTSFVADVDRRKKVWNHVAMNYSSKILSQNQHSVVIETAISYTGIVEPSKIPLIGTDKMKSLDKTYKYKLMLNNHGQIIGGDWLSHDRPDFIWVNKKEEFKHQYYGKILDLTFY